MARMTFDILEKQSGSAPAPHEIGDRRGFEIGIHLRADALELAERLDLLEPGIEVAAIGATRRYLGSGVIESPIASCCFDRDAHIHGDLSRWCSQRLWASLAGPLKRSNTGREMIPDVASAHPGYDALM